MQAREEQMDDALDEALRLTFPASDPIAVTSADDEESEIGRLFRAGALRDRADRPR